MNSLRESLQEYIDLRRGLGYKMRDEGLMLPRFVSFMEEHHAEHISARLALEWAQCAAVQPAERARRLCFVRGFARHRSATDNLTEIPPPGRCHTEPLMPKRTCTPTMKSNGCWTRLWNFQWPGRPRRCAHGCFMD